MKTFLLSLGLIMTINTKSHARFENQRPEKGPSKMSFFETISLTTRFLFGENLGPKAKLPQVRPDLIAFRSPSESVKFIWLGHSTLLFNVDNQIILVDPVFHNAAPFSFLVKRFQTPALSLEQLPEVDTILISHDHYDHLDEETIRFFRSKRTRFIVPTNLGSHLKSWGISSDRITELGWDESTSTGSVTFTAAPAQHFSGRGLTDRNETLWASWVIRGKEESIYYSGDSGYGPHFADIGDKYGPFDYAFIENGQYNELWPDVHMNPDETIQAWADLQAKYFIPVHWGMFNLAFHEWDEPVRKTHSIAKAWKIPMITPKLGEIVDWKNTPSEPWWEKVEEKKVQPQVTFFRVREVERP